MTLVVGVDARPLRHPTSGIGRYTQEFLRRLVHNADTEFHLYSDGPLAAEWHTACHVRVIQSPAPSALTTQIAFPIWCRMDRVDVFWSPRHHLPWFAGVPLVVTIHDLVWRKAPKTMQRFGATLERVLMPASIRIASAIICVSTATKNDLIELNPAAEKRVAVIPLASRFKAHERPCPADRANPFILHVGTHEPRKNLTRLIRSFKRALASSGSNHRLVLAGKAGWKENIPELIQQLGLEANVSIVSEPDDEQLARLYEHCEFLAFPSLYEGFGLPIVEALSFGKPILTSTLSAMPEVAGDAALYIEPCSEAELTSALTCLMTDHAKREVLAEAAVIQARRFNWDKSAALTYDVLAAAGGTDS